MEVLDSFQALAADQTTCKLLHSQRQQCDTAWPPVPRQKGQQRHGKHQAEVHQQGREGGGEVGRTDHDNHPAGDHDDHPGAAVGQMETC